MKKKVDPKTFTRRQKIALVGVLAVLLVITTVIMIVTRSNEAPTALFELSPVVFEETGLREITAEEYEQKLADGESFLVLAHAVACPAGMPLTDVTKELAGEKAMTIYGLMQDEFKKSSLAREFKYLPSLVVVHNGKVVKWLDAESDEDLPAYKTLEGLKNWLSQVVKL